MTRKARSSKARKVGPPAMAIPAFIVATWIAAVGVGAWAGRASPPPSAERGAPQSITVRVPAGAPAARDWAHFFACSGLAADPPLIRATLMLNGGTSERIWRQGVGADTPVRVALAPIPGPPVSGAETIIEAAMRAVGDCGDTP